MDDFPCLGCWQITPGSPSSVPTENGGSPCGRLWVVFCQIHPKFPRVAERKLAGDQAASRGMPANEIICVTSADHPANFSCELNLPDHRRMSARWVLYRRITAGFLPDSMQNWPQGGRAANYAQLWRSYKVKYIDLDAQRVAMCLTSFIICMTNSENKSESYMFVCYLFNG